MKAKLPYGFLACAVFVIIDSQPLEAQTCDIFGVVADSLTRLRLPSANITIQGMSRGASTNNVGYYVIAKLPPGSYEVTASLMGYGKVIKSVTLRDGGSTELNFYLQSKPIEEQEVIISGSRKENRLETSVSAYVLHYKDLKSVPGAAQQDLL